MCSLVFQAAAIPRQPIRTGAVLLQGLPASAIRRIVLRRDADGQVWG